MATFYVWSGATGSGTGADFTNAFTTLVAANTAGAAGDDYIVASDHQEVLSATLTMKGTAALPNTITSVNRGTGLPQRMVDSTGSFDTGALELNMSGFISTWGLFLRPGGGASTTNNFGVFLGGNGNVQNHRNMSMSIPNVSGIQIRCGGGAVVNFDDLRITQGHPQVRLAPAAGGEFNIANSPSLFSAAANSAILSNGGGGTVRFVGADLSNQAAGAILFQSSVNVNQVVVFEGSVVNTALTISPFIRTQRADLINCSDQSGNILNSRYWREGTLTREATIVRTGGASDEASPISWKVVTNADARRAFPFETFDLTFFVPSAKVGVSTTATIHTVTDGVTLTDADCNLALGAAVTASSSLLTFTDDGPANPLATPANQPTSSEAWTTTGLSSPVYQQLAVTFTPTREGPHRLRVRVGRASTTLYICPKVEIA